MKFVILVVFIVFICTNSLSAGYFLVWDPAPLHDSGPVFRNCLDSLGYFGEYDVNISAHLNRLSDFAEIFIFLGNYPDNYILQDGEVVDSLCSYLDNGGQIYMEGDDTWWKDPQTNLHNYFNIQGEEGIITFPIRGVAGTFTEGMEFCHGGEPLRLAKLTPQGTAFIIFEDDSGKSIGVACDTLAYKTIGFSFTFGYLTDTLPPSRKIDLADSIMHFFENFAGKKEGEYQKAKTTDIILIASPNPFTEKTVISYRLSVTTHN